MKNNEKFLRDGYSVEEAVKETKSVAKSESALEVKIEKIEINGVIFNKRNDEFWIDYSPDLDSREAYKRIEGIMLDFQKTKGFINTIDLTRFPIISEFLKYFTEKEEYIKGIKVVDSYKWIYNILMVCLYEYSLKIIYNMEEPLLDSDLMANLQVLSKDIFSKIDPSIRVKIQKRGISVIQNIYTGFDTEYKNIDLKYNKLVSVQLAINTKSLLKIPKYSEYELSTLNTLTGEVYKVDKSKKDFNFFMVEKAINRCINEIRFLKYKSNDSSISILIEGLIRLNFPYMETDDNFVFSFPRTPIQPFIYYDEGQGCSFEDMVNQSNLIGEPYLKEDYERIIDLIKNISKEVNTNILRWKESKNENNREVLRVIETKSLPSEKEVEEIKISKMSRTLLRGLSEGDKVSITKIRNNYFIAHYTPADLSMLNDFDDFVEKLSIVNDTYVTLGKPIVIGGTKIKEEKSVVKELSKTGEVNESENINVKERKSKSERVVGGSNVILRDSWLLAPQGHKSLESLGKLYNYEKISLSKEQIENMDLLLKEDKELFDRYAIRDAIIALIHGNYMEDHNFKLQGLGIPLTLSSLGTIYVKYKWKMMGYKGYQISPKYLIGDTSATQTPKGLYTTSQTGLKLSYYIANYKGGRNESYMYGSSSKIRTVDYDLTSAYTTAMAGLGNPDYNKGRSISVRELEKMSFNDILYSYVIMKAKFKFNSKTKFPSIPANVDEDVSVYALEGESIINGAEYLLAKSQKCKLQISEVYYLPFEKDKEGNLINQPFKSIINEIQAERRKHPKGTIENLTEKEKGNSIYGSTARGISNKKKFDIKSGTTVRMEAGELSNPIIASWITAFIRSVVGESLDNISKINGYVVSATTDGFITNVENLEMKIVGRKYSLLNALKYYESKLQEDERFIRSNFTFKEDFEDIDLKDGFDNLIGLDSKMIKDFLENITNFRDIITSLRTKLNKLNWSGGDSLLKEYKRLRYELSGDDSALEIKKGGKGERGIISITTRVQLGKEAGIKAATGFQSKRYTLDELDFLFKEALKSEYKSLEFVNQSLRSALDIYKEEGQITPLFKDKKFRLHYDNKRLIILPEELENTIDFSDILLDSKPVSNSEYSRVLRFLSKFNKQSLYNKQTSSSSGSIYRSYLELAVRNFIKGLLSNPQKFNLNTEVTSYSDLIKFVKDFDNEIKITKQSISNLKNRQIIFKTVPRTKETLKFIDYVKEKYKDFDDESFFVGKVDKEEVAASLLEKRNKMKWSEVKWSGVWSKIQYFLYFVVRTITNFFWLYLIYLIMIILTKIFRIMCVF